MRHPFYGDESKRQFYSNRMGAHIAADQLVQGMGWNAGYKKGCFIGCTLDDYDHDSFCDVINVPMQVAYICDTLHESLPKDRTAEFAMRFFREVNLKGNTEHWWPKFVERLVNDPVFGVFGIIKALEDDTAMKRGILILYQEQEKSQAIGEMLWSAARLFAGAPGPTDTRGAHFIWQAETFLDIISHPA